MSTFLFEATIRKKKFRFSSKKLLFAPFFGNFKTEKAFKKQFWAIYFKNYSKDKLL